MYFLLEQRKDNFSSPLTLKGHDEELQEFLSRMDLCVYLTRSSCILLTLVISSGQVDIATLLESPKVETPSLPSQDPEAAQDTDVEVPLAQLVEDSPISEPPSTPPSQPLKETDSAELLPGPQDDLGPVEPTAGEASPITSEHQETHLSDDVAEEQLVTIREPSKPASLAVPVVEEPSRSTPERSHQTVELEPSAEGMDVDEELEVPSNHAESSPPDNEPMPGVHTTVDDGQTSLSSSVDPLAASQLQGDSTTTSQQQSLSTQSFPLDQTETLVYPDDPETSHLFEAILSQDHVGPPEDNATAASAPVDVPGDTLTPQHEVTDTMDVVEEQPELLHPTVNQNEVLPQTYLLSHNDPPLPLAKSDSGTSSHYTLAVAPAATLLVPSYSFESEMDGSVANEQEDVKPPRRIAPSKSQQFNSQYTLPPLNVLPAEFQRKAKPTRRGKRDKDKDKLDGRTHAEWTPMGINKWGAIVRANPIHKKLSRAPKCLSTQDWSVCANMLYLMWKLTPL